MNFFFASAIALAEWLEATLDREASADGLGEEDSLIAASIRFRYVLIYGADL